MNTVLTIGLALLLAGLLPLNARSAEGKPGVDKSEPGEAPPKAPKKSGRHTPFRGKLDGVNAEANTIKVGDRTFAVTASTRILKDGKPATLDVARAGDEVAGAFRESEAGRMELISLRLGPKPEGKKEDRKPDGE